MIVLVWSLVSSVVELARRKRLASFLDRFLASDLAQSNILLCSRTTESSPEELGLDSDSTGRLVRFTSEPQLNFQRVLYKNEQCQVSIEPSQQLTLSDWRFAAATTLGSTDGRPVYFMVIPVKTSPEDQRAEDSTATIYLQSYCERIAWNRLQPASIYVCSTERFVDIVYAFSESVLYENNRQSLIGTVQTISKACLPETTCIGSSSKIAQKALPLLEQLFWGDGSSLKSVKKRFVSEQTLAPGSFGSLPRHFQISPRRRHRSCNYSTNSLTSTPRKAAITLIGDLAEQSCKFFDNSQLPPFLRYIDSKERRLSVTSKTTGGENMSLPSSNGVSPSITIEELDHRSSCRSDEDSDIPYADESLASPHSTIEKSSYATLVQRQENPWSSRETAEPPLSNAKSLKEIETLCEEAASPTNEKANCLNNPLYNENADAPLSEGNDMALSTISDLQQPSSNSSEFHNNNEPKRILSINGRQRQENGQMRNSDQLPPSGHSGESTSFRKKPATARNGSNSIMHRSAQEISRRRHSAMPSSTMYLESDEEQSGRYRSLSPIHQYYYHRRSISGRSGDILFERNSFRRPYTPTRKFLSSKASSDKAMYKPPSILVYTANQSDLFDRIRKNLTGILPPDKYTVFNISAEALRKQPWIEPTTSCVVIANTKDLDDAAWAKMQTYFNQAGKIIFVCQNNLLASLTDCDSSKKQAGILRMAFGSRDSVSMGKEFEQFLKKSLKTLRKHSHVNEKFHSKDLIGGLSYSVVLSKTPESPLLLYMQNSAHQATAIFSDATCEELLAPGNKILSESLSRIGVTVTETIVPAFTRGYLVPQEDSLIDDLKGIRYGENIGIKPKLFLRTSEKAQEDGIPEAEENLLPVEVGTKDNIDTTFNFEIFFNRLDTARLGRIALYVPVLTTTMDVCNSLCDAIPTCDHSVVIAGQQVAGKGRGGNEFISPKGAAMFSCSVVLPKSCILVRNPSFIQHVFAVSVVDAVHSLSGLEEFPLRIKWPNDFYFNKSHKLGGLLATCRSRDDCFLFTVGAGINVTNSKPTLCLNDIVPENENVRFTVEDVIAESLNKLQYWLGMYELKGQKSFVETYYKYWLHSGDEVTLEEQGEKCIIRGLDQNGYLQVRSKSNSNKLFSVCDDGNTFDMMKGLIRQKL